MTLPKIACLCCTFLRPRQLAEAVECFLRQDYPLNRRELIILDDAGQYEAHGGAGWRLISLSRRFATLGEKRNACAALASPDSEIYAVWDDDDIYLPSHLKVMAAAMEDASWTVPSHVWIDKVDHLVKGRTNGLFHPSWGFRRDVFAGVDGYPFMGSGEDQALKQRFIERLGLTAADPCRQHPPTFIYRWCTSGCDWHISAMPPSGYHGLAHRASSTEKIECVRPKWTRDWPALAESAIAYLSRPHH